MKRVNGTHSIARPPPFSATVKAGNGTALLLNTSVDKSNIWMLRREVKTGSPAV